LALVLLSVLSVRCVRPLSRLPAEALIRTCYLLFFRTGIDGFQRLVPDFFRLRARVRTKARRCPFLPAKGEAGRHNGYRLANRVGRGY